MAWACFKKTRNRDNKVSKENICERKDRKKAQKAVIRCDISDMKRANVNIENVGDQVKWKLRISVADFK